MSFREKREKMIVITIYDTDNILFSFTSFLNTKLDWKIKADIIQETRTKLVLYTGETTELESMSPNLASV